MVDGKNEKLEIMERVVNTQWEWIQSEEGKSAIARENEARRADHCGMGYWFPRILDAGLPVPETVLIPAPRDLIRILDGESPDGFDEFVEKIEAAGNELGWPCFFRTEQGSGKHCWKDTCYLSSPEQIKQHVFNLVEWSECVAITGLSYYVWAVREMLPVTQLGTCIRYGNMPIVRELRLFTEDGKVCCVHPYWPEETIADGSPLWTHPDVDSPSRDVSCDEIDAVRPLAERAAAACPGDDWSIDFLLTANGWFLTDMAIADRSFHWEGCKMAKGGA